MRCTQITVLASSIFTGHWNDQKHIQRSITRLDFHVLTQEKQNFDFSYPVNRAIILHTTGWTVELHSTAGLTCLTAVVYVCFVSSQHKFEHFHPFCAFPHSPVSNYWRIGDKEKDDIQSAYCKFSQLEDNQTTSCEAHVIFVLHRAMKTLL